MKLLTVLLVGGLVALPATAWSANANRFVFPVLGNHQTDPVHNTTNPTTDGWYINNNIGSNCPSCIPDETCSPAYVYHPGQDINRTGGDVGLPVYAVANGRVTRVADLTASGLGYAVIIKHSLCKTEDLSDYFLPGTTIPSSMKNTSEVSSCYIHIQDVGPLLACGGVGAVVTVGQQIGTIYNLSSGPHLHFEMRANWDCRTADPSTQCAGYYTNQQDISDFGYIDAMKFVARHLADCDVTAPSTPTNLSVNPTGCSQTSGFAFNWSASTDGGGSGLAGYEWNVNGAGNTATTALSAGYAAPAAGSYTFNVRAYDNAGNRSAYASIGFCYQPPTGPCPGRQIPNTCVPSSTCYPAATANLITLPDMSAEQWATVGQPIRSMLKPGVRYSVGFEYRSATSTEISLGLTSFSPALTGLGLVACQSSLPEAGDWKTFWTAPFTATAEQLERFSSLRLVPSSTGGFEVRKLQMVAYP